LESALPAFARELLALAPRKFSSRKLPSIVGIPSSAQPRGRVGMISGCVMPVMFGNTNIATAELLANAGWEVVAPRSQVCCGALYAHSGRLELARDCARKNIDAFAEHPLDAIIINAAGCGSTLKEYGRLLADDPAYAAKAAHFASKVKDLVEWLPPNSFSGMEGRWAGRVTYHDACHLAHAQRITKQPRELVKAVAGQNYVELPEADLCCGSAGTYNLTQPEMAGRLQKRKIGNILRTGAQIVVTTNPGCLLQIEAGLRQAGVRHVKAMHIADFLKSATPPAQRASKTE
jgi:glycolate oxidase iron-sulfur subunit